MGSVMVSAASVIASVIAGAIASWLLSGTFVRRGRGTTRAIDAAEFRRRRIARLTGSLADAELLIGEIQAEVELGQKRAEALEVEVQRMTELSKLTKEQTDAVARLVGDTLELGERRAFRKEFWMNFGFFISGLLVAVVFAIVGFG
jgi:hypothetical protein